jgi:hypothetical protein
VAAAPLFVISVVAQEATRAGFDPRRHPLSLLSLGDLGWIQICTFVVAGVLATGSALGLRRPIGGGEVGGDRHDVGAPDGRAEALGRLRGAVGVSRQVRSAAASGVGAGEGTVPSTAVSAGAFCARAANRNGRPSAEMPAEST